jgi:hypothetical protein
MIKAAINEAQAGERTGAPRACRTETGPIEVVCAID